MQTFTSDNWNLLPLDSDIMMKRASFQVMELQNTLQDLSSRVDNVRGENCKLKTENAVLCEYIEKLMRASAMFNGEEGAGSTKGEGKRVPHSSGSNLGAVVREVCLNQCILGLGRAPFAIIP